MHRSRLLLLAAGGVIGTLVLLASRSPDRPNARVDVPPSRTAPSPRTPSAASRRPSPPSGTPASSEQTVTDALQSLRDRVPSYDPADAAIHRFAINGEPALPDVVRRALSATVNSVPLEEPPYRAEWMLGPRDAAWLDALAREFGTERDIRITRRLVSQPGTLPGDHDESVCREIAPKYVAFLTDVSRARLADDPELQERFRDVRRVHELEAGSPERLWLETVIGHLASSHMWVHHPDRVSVDDLQLLSAADLGELARLRATALEIQARDAASDVKTPPALLYAPVVDAFLRLVESRRVR